MYSVHVSLRAHEPGGWVLCVVAIVTSPECNACFCKRATFSLITFVVVTVTWSPRFFFFFFLTVSSSSSGEVEYFFLHPKVRVYARMVTLVHIHLPKTNDFFLENVTFAEFWRFNQQYAAVPRPESLLSTRWWMFWNQMIYAYRLLCEFLSVRRLMGSLTFLSILCKDHSGISALLLWAWWMRQWGNVKAAPKLCHQTYRTALWMSEPTNDLCCQWDDFFFFLKQVFLLISSTLSALQCL